MKLFNFILDKLMTYRIGAISGNMNEGKNDSNYSII